METEELRFNELRSAVAGNAVAIRRITTLRPAGGETDKIYPPTYLEGPYAEEERLVRDADGSLRTVNTVLLDSVQSQANRMELALLRGYRQGKLRLPMAVVDFISGEDDPLLRDIGEITALEAPHRIADAILRDSQFDGIDFRKSSVGRCLDEVRTTNATPLFGLAPSSLVFGMWDSTGPRGGSGAKFSRVLASEIVGFNAVPGKRGAGRLDPLAIENIESLDKPIYRTSDNGWSFDRADAVTDKKGTPITLKPSQINHGNIAPSLKNKDTREYNPGGFTISHAVQTTVISLSGLRRLRFPLNGADMLKQSATDLAAQTTLAALALAAVCWHHEEGYGLRSRCWLEGKSGPFEIVGQGEARAYTLTAEQSALLLEQAAAEAVRQGLSWPVEPVRLTPTGRLKDLTRKSREKTLAVSEG